MTDGYAARRLEIGVRDRARFGAGIVAELPSALADLGCASAFVVTDRGVVGSGVAGRIVDLLRAADVRVELFDAVEPNPGSASNDSGGARRRARRRVRDGLRQGDGAPCHQRP
jgi:alcohol dehydrogenase class IV